MDMSTFELNQGSIIGTLDRIIEDEYKGKKSLELIVKVHNYKKQPQFIPIRVYNEVKISYIKNNISEGEKILVTYSLSGREYNNKYYINAYMDSIQKFPINPKEKFKMKGKKDDEDDYSKIIDPIIDDDDDLPF